MFHRPLQPDQYLEYFKHTAAEQGDILNVQESPMDRVPGKRQSWMYEVSYAGGEIKGFVVPSPGLPVRYLSVEELTDKLNSIRSQPFR
jgi:hypothetical protein